MSKVIRSLEEVALDAIPLLITAAAVIRAAKADDIHTFHLPKKGSGEGGKVRMLTDVLDALAVEMKDARHRALAEKGGA